MIVYFGCGLFALDWLVCYCRWFMAVYGYGLLICGLVVWVRVFSCALVVVVWFCYLTWVVCWSVSLVGLCFVLVAAAGWFVDLVV